MRKGVDKHKKIVYNVGTKEREVIKMIEIARIMTFGTVNRRDIIRRLMGCCKSFKNMTFSTAMETYRSYESAGLVRHGDGWLAIYHDCEN